MQKNIIKLMSITLMVMFMVSCGKSAPDLRDPFVGSYKFAATGEMILDFANQQKVLPLATGGTFRITKDGSANRVKLTGDYTGAGYIDGELLILDAENFTKSEDGYSITALVTYEPAELINNQLVIIENMSGSCYGQGKTGTVSGSSVTTAVKQ